MARQIAYNFGPEFPASTVDRYPSLSRALGNNYPGVRIVAPKEDSQKPSGSPSNPVPNAWHPAAAFRPHVAYDFGPEFPASTVDRYPSLSRALGNEYPGVRIVATIEDSLEPSNSPFDPVLNAHPAAPLRPDVAEQFFFGEASNISVNNSIMGDNYLPSPGRPLPSAFSRTPPKVGPHETSVTSDDLVPLSASISNDLHICDSPFLNVPDLTSDPGGLPFLGTGASPSASLNPCAYGTSECSQRPGSCPDYNSQDLYRPDLYFPSHRSLPRASAEAGHEKSPGGHEYFIPICDSPTSTNTTLVGSSSHSPSLPSTSLRGCAGSGVKEHPPQAHECPVCHKWFTRPSALQTHNNKHTGKKPFVCDFPGCLKRFGAQSNLLRHEVAHGIKRSGRGGVTKRVGLGLPQSYGVGLNPMEVGLSPIEVGLQMALAADVNRRLNDSDRYEIRYRRHSGILFFPPS
ncbi:hypothetical protein C8R47DRAFT_1328967, partial [Mycena vitilis]